MKKIVLFGGGAHVSCCIDIIEKTNEYIIIGITDPFLAVGTEIMGYKIIGKQEEIIELKSKYSIDGGIITIGDNWTRKMVYDEIIKTDPDFEFFSAIHPTVVLGANVTIGKGSVMMAGCIVSPNSIVGDFCFFATGAILEHDCFMDDFSSISVGSLTGGKVKIGKYTAITLGVVLFDRVVIGEHTVIGSGALVTKDIPSNCLAYGTPAKVVRKRKIGERYLK